MATQFATVFGIWFRGFGLPQLNWPVANGELILGLPATAAPTATTYFVGEISHFADGVFFALLFALLFHPFVPLRNMSIPQHAASRSRRRTTLMMTRVTLPPASLRPC